MNPLGEKYVSSTFMDAEKLIIPKRFRRDLTFTKCIKYKCLPFKS